METKILHESQLYKGNLQKLKERMEQVPNRIVTVEEKKTAFGFPTIYLQDEKQKDQIRAKAGCPGESQKN